MPPLLRLGARRRRPTSSPSTGARGRRCPPKLADVAAPWSSRTSRSPPPLEFAAAPLARRSNSRAMCGGRHGRAEASASAAAMGGGGGGRTRGRRIHSGLLTQGASLAAGAMEPPWPLPPCTRGGRGLTGGAGVAGGGGALARSPSPRALQLLAGEGKEEGRAGTEEDSRAREERRAGGGRSGA